MRYLLPTFIQAILITYSTAYTCLDENQNEVDWIIAIKLPGVGKYIVMDASNGKNWRLSHFDINGTNGFFFNTLNQIYSNQNEEYSFHLMYNDAPPVIRRKRASFFGRKTGHMKGVVSFKRNQSGFWLVHSVPRGPGSTFFQYPRSGIRNSQSFFCSTFNYQTLPEIAEQILIGEPDVYKCHISPHIQEDFPLVNDLCLELSKRSEYRTTKFQVLKPNFYHFSKGSLFGDDLYSGFIALKLKTALYVQSWRLIPIGIHSNCSTPYHVYNIDELQISDVMDFKYTKDHSKWAVSKNKLYVCIGDINRARTQFLRGGGALCMEDATVASRFFDLIKKVEECKEKKKRKRPEEDCEIKRTKREREACKERNKTREGVPVYIVVVICVVIILIGSAGYVMNKNMIYLYKKY